MNTKYKYWLIWLIYFSVMLVITTPLYHTEPIKMVVYSLVASFFAGMLNRIIEILEDIKSKQ